MRINTPVTNVEFEIKDGSSIVSKTDLKGLITYVNPEFIEASGFAEQELLGQPHNIVRHPDMPAEVFDDFWLTLKKGRPWTGVVKNRRKDGSYYWVVANTTPIFEGGSAVGYMSVRSKPTRAQVAMHEEIYRLFREGKPGGLRIVEGRAVKSGAWRTLLGMFGNMHEKSKMIAVFGVMMCAMLLTNLASYYSAKYTESEMADIVTRRMVIKQDVQSLQYLLAANRLEMVLALQSGTHGKPAGSRDSHERALSEHLDALTANDKEISALLKQIKGRVIDEKMIALISGAEQLIQKAENEDMPQLRRSLQDGRYAAAQSVLLDRVDPVYREAGSVLAEANDRQTELTRSSYQSASDNAYASRRFQVTVSVVSILVAALIGILLMRYIVASLRMANRQLRRIAQGNYSDHIEVKRADETGLLLYAMKSMQIRMGIEVSDAKRISDEVTRVKIGLDNVSTNVMIADRHRNIIYMNKAITEMFSAAQDDIRKDFPAFAAANLLGTNIDQFHQNPAHQVQLLDKLRGTHKINLKIGVRTFTLTVNAVLNEQGEHLGSAVEWIDRTAELAVENEIANIVAAAARGDFTQRIRLEGKAGFFLQMGENINQLLETSSVGLNEVVRVLGALAQGDLTEVISNEYSGTFGKLKDDSNVTVAQLTETIRRIKDATDAISTASKEIASGNADLSQRTEEQASSLEETAASMEELTATVKQNAENAKQANRLALSASDIAVKGGQVVGEVVGTMSSISESSKKIVDIISVIDGIAFQTNILALNAAVEAARAGEQGRGFAVVASEVRNLAQRSAAAAKEIKGLISDSVEKVGAGTRLVDDAGKTMNEVVSAVKRVTDIMAEITAASTEQSQGIAQVNTTITQMDDVTQQNAALVEQAAAAAESLEEQVDELSVLMSAFKLSGELSVAHPKQRASAIRQLPAGPHKLMSRNRPPPPKLEDFADGEWKEF